MLWPAQADIAEHICGDDPWLVLHKVDSPVKMRQLGQHFASCPSPSV